MATSGPASSSSPSPATRQSALDNSIWYILSLWHPLHIAITSSWGGPLSSDKRDWMAGAVSDLLTTRPDTTSSDLEEFLLDIMMDEFECNVEDDSEVEIAESILKVRERVIVDGDLNAAREVEERWKRRGTMKGDVVVKEVEEEGEWEGIEEDDDEDEEMTDAPQLVPAGPPKEKIKPEIDEDGFTKVVGRKNR